MLRRLIPRKFDFFSSFEQAADCAVEAARLLLKMIEDPSGDGSKAGEIEGIEHACDKITQDALKQLNQVFITPLDREDILDLIIRLDDIVDMINSSAGHMVLFDIRKPTPHSASMAQQILRGCERLAEAVRGLRSTKNYEAITRNCIAIHEVEDAADAIFQGALADLFRTEKDPIEVIKWKDVYESMEAVADRLEIVANVIQSVIVKMS